MYYCILYAKPHDHNKGQESWLGLAKDIYICMCWNPKLGGIPIAGGRATTDASAWLVRALASY